MSRLIEAMEACMQTPTQNVLEHGRSVVAHFSLMTDHIRHGTPLPSWWRLPAWAIAAGILDNLPSDAILREYHEFHDCGKRGRAVMALRAAHSQSIQSSMR